MKGYRDLLIWQKAMDLVEDVYRATKEFPNSEKYGLTNQIHRAAVSVPANIAEGSGREHPKELIQFLAIAKGSLMEIETHLLIAERLGYLKEEKVNTLISQSSEIARMTMGLIRSVRKRKN